MRPLPILIAICLASVVNAVAEPSWKEILGPPQGTVPAAASFTVTWRTNLTAAMTEARKGNRPLFVTFRCLPCKQCSAFDKEILEGGPDLDPILNQFVTVRLTDAANIDLRVFPVEGFADLDLSWWGWFLSPEGRVYGVFGGRDEVSDATRISKPALVASLIRVLAHHYDPRRSQWDTDGPAPELAGPTQSPRQLPGYEGWVKLTREGDKNQACLHCHQVNDILRAPAVLAKTFDKHRDFEVWPLPENIGLALDRDHGLLVTNVFAGGPAEKAGVRVGDVLGAVGGRRCFSQADVRGALHRGPRGAGTVDLWWTRSGEVMTGSLPLTDGWRKTVLDWRMSVSQGIVGAYPGFFPLAIKPERREKLHITPGKMAVEPYMGNNTNSVAYRTGIRGSHIITAVNGESPDLAGRAFLVWFNQKYEPGDLITTSIVDRSGQKQEFTYKLLSHGE